MKCQREADTLQASICEIYSNLASKLYAAEPEDARPGGKDEAAAQQQVHPRPEDCIHGRQYRSRNTAQR